MKLLLALGMIASVTAVHGMEQKAIGNKERSVMSYELIAFDEKDNLVRGIAQHCNKSIIVPQLVRFADSEIRVSFDDASVFEGKKAVIVQSTFHPVHERLLSVAFLVQELKNANAEQVIATIPYFGYSRQEKSDISGKPGPARVVAKLLEGAGIDQLIALELHDSTIKKFFSVPVHDLIIPKLIAEHIKKQFPLLQSICLVAPDAGAQEHVQAVADELGIGVLVFTKERYGTNKTRVLGMTGECRGKTAIIIDDIIDTGGTAINVCNELITEGFKEVFGYFTHPVLSGNALERIAQSPFKKLFVSDSIPLPADLQGVDIETFDVSAELATLIQKLV